MTRYYVTMTWDDWPEGGSYGTVVEADDIEQAELLCRLEMADSRADEMERARGYETALACLEAMGDKWETVDCFNLDAFIQRYGKVDDLRGALQRCVEQIEQMRGMFDDEDGTIAATIQDARGALEPVRLPE